MARQPTQQTNESEINQSMYLSSRELELGVFTILHYGPLSRTVVDSDNHTEEREELLLRPPQLCLLLQDLNVKVTSTLSAFGKGAGGKVLLSGWGDFLQ